jgi:hypothetical protein
MLEIFGGPDRDRTDDLFHAMEARSQTAPQAHIGGQHFYFHRLQSIRQTSTPAFTPCIRLPATAHSGACT